MALFELNSDITIGTFRFSGVHEVVIKRGLHSIADTAIIKIPSNGRIAEHGTATDIITSEKFADGDHVTIKLGYNGDMHTEFEGFVKRRNLDMPLEIECEGYSWLLKNNTIRNSGSNSTVKELLNIAVSGIDSSYPITVRCDVDIDLGNVRLADKSGAEVIQFILDATDNCLSIFFIEPDVLWCGYVYTDWAEGWDTMKAGSVDYSLGYNTLKGNSLKKRTPQKKESIRYSKRKPKGTPLTKVSDAYNKYVRSHSKILNYIQSDNTLQELANEQAHRNNYVGYEGAITGFLQPYAAPGYKATITDGRYKEQDGIYLIESTEVVFGIKGARRIMEIGPKLGFIKENNGQ